MRISLYFVFSVILIALTGAYINTLHLGMHTHALFSREITLPVTVWIVLPMALLAFFSLLHMVYYSMKNFFIKKKFLKDIHTLNDAIYWSLLHEPKEYKYYTKEIRSSGKLFTKSTLNYKGSTESMPEKFMGTVALIKDIERGEYIDLREKKLDKKLSKENPIVVKNNLNRLEVDSKYVEEVLQSVGEQDTEVVSRALKIFVSKETFFKAKKYSKILDVSNFFVLLEREINGEDLGFNEDMVRFFVAELNFACPEYMNLARFCLKKFSPDVNLALFKEFKMKDENASRAYLYLLFEYELLDQIEDFLLEQGDKEYIRFRALFTLKKMNNKYNVESLVSSNAVCNEN